MSPFDSTAMEVLCMKARPNKKSPRFNADLLPKNKSFWLVHWAITRLLPGDAFSSRVNSLVNRFEEEILHFFNCNPDENIPEMVSACKKRASTLCDYLQSIMILLSRGYTLVPMTKDIEFIQSDYKIRFTRKLMGVPSTNEDCDVLLDVQISNHPRMYRYLYDAINIILRSAHWRNEDISRLCVILQSLAYYFESVNLTDSETKAIEDEFLDSANSGDVWDPHSASASTWDLLVRDELSPNPPKYIADVKRVRRFTDGYTHNNPWGMRDMAYSLSSSGSRWTFNGRRIPNIGILFSALEPNTESVLDPIIGYKNLYSSVAADGLEFIPSSTLFVPKTSSRGKRAVHPQANSRQDRGQYFENMAKTILNDIIKGDSTFDDQSTFLWILEEEAREDRVLVCTDVHAATDNTSHTYLLKTWNLLFREGIADGLLELHSGPGRITHLVLENGEYKEITEDYNQTSGIKCGTRSNFAVGLALPHHLIVRMTMKYLHLEDVDPSSIYRLKGDDIVFSLPLNIWRQFIEAYTQIANECGFKVHPIDEKGMISMPGDTLYRAEWSKQIWSSGHLVSRIPHRLFFRDCSRETEFQLILWLSQYDLLGIDYMDCMQLFKQYFLNVYSTIQATQLWNFLIDKKLFGLNVGLRFPTDTELPLSEQFKFAKAIFYHAIDNSIFDTVFNNRQRLSASEVKEKLKQYVKFYEDDEVMTFITSWVSENCPEGKLQHVLDLNENFAEELKSIFDQPYIWFNARIGVFTEEEKTLIRSCLPYFRLSNIDFDSLTIDKLLQAANILKRTQPHSIGKQVSLKTRTILDTMRDILTESESYATSYCSDSVG